MPGQLSFPNNGLSVHKKLTTSSFTRRFRTFCRTTQPSVLGTHPACSRTVKGKAYRAWHQFMEKIWRIEL